MSRFDSACDTRRGVETLHAGGVTFRRPRACPVSGSNPSNGPAATEPVRGGLASYSRVRDRRPCSPNENSMSLNPGVLTSWFEQHRSFLWGLSYRMTGSAADADDIVQETFVRAYQHAPAHLDDPRRWLMRVAVNAGRDVLRR